MKANSAVATELTKSNEQHEIAPAHRSIWLATWLYELLPYFYIFAGTGAILSAAYVRRWYWAVPTILVFGCLCVHTGFIVRRLRREHRARKARIAPTSDSETNEP